MNFICVTCGTEYEDSAEPPPACRICTDERQYVGLEGQHWTTLAELQKTHRNKLATEESGLASIITDPKFAIGQRAFLLETPQGNVLWDCISLIDVETVRAINDRGLKKSIAYLSGHVRVPANGRER